MILLVILSIVLPLANSVELTFELPDSAKECFYEVIEKGTQATVEFQVEKTSM
jgi:protein ERP2